MKHLFLIPFLLLGLLGSSQAAYRIDESYALYDVVLAINDARYDLQEQLWIEDDMRVEPSAECVKSSPEELKLEYLNVVNSFVNVFEDEPLDYRDAQQELGSIIDGKDLKRCVSNIDNLKVSHYISSDSELGIKFKYKSL